MSLTPVTFEADYAEPRSRLTTFFRLLMAIPHYVVLMVWGFAAFFAIVIAWFALVLTGRWPRGLYAFTAGLLRYSTAVTGYLYLLTDVYPPFSGNVDGYPVRLGLGEPKPEYSRMKALFRIILAIPPMIIAYAMGIVAQVGALLAWFAIVVLGKQPRALQDMIELGLSYQQRAYAYIYLLTEDWPPFTSPQPALGAGPSSGGLPSAPAGFAAPVAPEAVTTRRDDDPPPPPPAGGLTSGDPLGG